jgi:alkaline ceramidase
MFELDFNPIDWCEPNYVYSQYIAEFWNTISNIIFLIMGFYGIKYCRNNKLPSIYLYIFLTYILIGVFSAYFHATLTIYGQLLDEIGIYVTIILGLCSYLNINILCIIPFILLLFIYPKYNPYMLFVLGFFSAYMVLTSFSKMNNLQKRFGVIIVATFLISVFFWVFDRICWYNGHIHTHFIFHVTIGLTGFMAIVFLDYIKNNRKDHSTLINAFDIDIV